MKPGSRKPSVSSSSLPRGAIPDEGDAWLEPGWSMASWRWWRETRADSASNSRPLRELSFRNSVIRLRTDARSAQTDLRACRHKGGFLAHGVPGPARWAARCPRPRKRRLPVFLTNIPAFFSADGGGAQTSIHAPSRPINADSTKLTQVRRKQHPGSRRRDSVMP